MKTPSNLILAGALGVVLSLTTPTRADEPEPKRPLVEQARREVEAQRREAEEQRDRAETLLRRDAEARRPETRREGREEDRVQSRVNEAESLRARLQELVAAGRKEEAEQVRRQLEEMESRPGEPRRRPIPPGDGPEEVERRVKHLAIATENLLAAGNHELAENLQRQIEQMKRPVREQRGSRLPGNRQPRLNLTVEDSSL